MKGPASGTRLHLEARRDLNRPVNGTVDRTVVLVDPMDPIEDVSSLRWYGQAIVNADAA
jgi:hypothetical protein